MRILFVFLISLGPAFALAQASTYVSRVDEELTIREWTFLPLVDNTGGVYAKPLTDRLRELMESAREFSFQASPGVSPVEAPEVFEENPKAAIEFMRKNSVDAFVTGRIARGPQGFTVRLALFSGKDGLPVAIESKTGIRNFEISSLKSDLEEVFRALKRKIPYRGVVLSRRGTEVTLNLGDRDGLRPGQEILAIQLTQVQRHPRFGFIVGVEKEIMGKIRITKTDDSLSFGSIVSERSPGLVKPGFKLTVDEFVDYGAKPGLTDREDSAVAFGSDPREWRPLDPPSFGKVALMVGLGDYSISNNLASSGSVSGRNSMVPSMHVEGEMWLSAHWFLGLELHQYVTKIDNGLAGSSPGSLNLQTLELELVGGYNILVSEQFWGPKLQLMFGINQMDSKIDDSTPTALTSNKFGGMAFGVAGSVPMGTTSPFPVTLGGKFMYYWNPSFSEAPVTSGSSASSRISTFSLFGEYQAAERLAYRGELSFKQYGASLSGSGSRFDSATSVGHAMTTLAGGVVFLF